MYTNELEELENIIDLLVTDEEPSIFTEEFILDLFETVFILIDDYLEENPSAIAEPDFYEILLEEIEDLFMIQLDDYLMSIIYYDNVDEIEDDLEELIEEAVSMFITTFYPERSISQTPMDFSEQEEKHEEEILILEKKINLLREIPQPDQRTDEWYKFRHNLITASNAYKAFESQSTINQLVYEKCQPLKTASVDSLEDEGIKMVNTNTTLHWGQKYEPLSVLIYEEMFKTVVEDFGCIQHPIHSFIGASPDGINVDKKSNLYGRMLEIKNIVNREINGIPKKEYWVQMQLQMEVCDLNECDFLETKFTEYVDYQSFLNDTLMEDNNTTANIDQSVSSNKKPKGIIIYFHTKEGKPFYVYKPLHLKYAYEISVWEEEMIHLYQSDKYNYTFLKYLYWKLEIMSCVLVLRNKEWFKNNVPQLEKVWKIIEEERVTGYEHRAPNKKVKKEINKPLVVIKTDNYQGCLLKLS